MVVRVYENIYMIEVVLPNNPLKALNSYVIKGEDKSLIIDTGFNQKDSIDALFGGLKELNIDIKDTQLFITHMHADHSGMASLFEEAGVKIYASEADGKTINNMTNDSYWKELDKFKLLFGLEVDDITFKEHPGYINALKSPVGFTYVEEGHQIEIDDYVLEVVSMPGHTLGHIGLYERNRKLLFGGDHILDRITPNIGFLELESDLLGTYLNSLAKIRALDIAYLFPSHRNIIRDHKKRIDELVLHHEDRLDEVLKILEEGELTVKEVASRMSWGIRVSNWDDFPGQQKWFASEEAMSHLQHLQFKRKVTRGLKEGKFHYKLI